MDGRELLTRGLPNQPPPIRSLRAWLREGWCGLAHGHCWHEERLNDGRHWWNCCLCGRNEW